MDADLGGMTLKERHEYRQLREAHDAMLRANPLLGFHACEEWCGSPVCKPRPKQREYMAASERIVLEAAGNRFGKTTANVVYAIIQHCPAELLPERLRDFRRERPPGAAGVPVTGRYVAPSEKALLNIVIPAFQRWIPKAIMRGERWDKAYTDKYKVLHFRDGGRLEFYTSEQDAAVMVGTDLDYCIFDEPTTEAIWKECWMRLTDRSGAARFGLTPVNMKGGGIGWLYRQIYKRGIAGEPYPGTTLVPRVLRGTIHDNPGLTEEQKAEALAIYDEDEREARETGEFVAFGGLIYPGFKKHIVPLDPDDPDDRKRIQRRDTIIGIDPSYRRSALVWISFGSENDGIVFHVVYVRKTDVRKVVMALSQGNKYWDLKQQPMYVMDPYAGGQHNAASGSTVTMKSELQQLGIFTHTPKVLDSSAIVYGGVLNIRRRMAEGSFSVGSCVDAEFLLEAEEYRVEDREDGVFQVVKEFDDGMDAMRYAFTQRPWYPKPTEPVDTEDWAPDHAPDWSKYDPGGPFMEYPAATGVMT